MTKNESVLHRALHEKAGFFGKGNNAGKKRRQQEKRKTNYEMDRLNKRSHRHESTGAEQGCWGQDSVNITHPS